MPTHFSYLLELHAFCVDFTTARDCRACVIPYVGRDLLPACADCQDLLHGPRWTLIRRCHSCHSPPPATLTTTFYLTFTRTYLYCNYLPSTWFFPYAPVSLVIAMPDGGHGGAAGSTLHARTFRRLGFFGQTYSCTVEPFGSCCYCALNFWFVTLTCMPCLPSCLLDFAAFGSLPHRSLRYNSSGQLILPPCYLDSTTFFTQPAVLTWTGPATPLAVSAFAL